MSYAFVIIPFRQVNRQAKPGEAHRLHLVQRHRKSGHIRLAAWHWKSRSRRRAHTGHGPSTH